MLPKELILHIGRYTRNLGDLWSLMACCSSLYYKDLIHKLFWERVRQKIPWFDASKFDQEFKWWALTGSFVVATLLGADWTLGDIDIIHVNNYPDLETYLSTTQEEFKEIEKSMQPNFRRLLDKGYDLGLVRGQYNGLEWENVKAFKAETAPFHFMRMPLLELRHEGVRDSERLTDFKGSSRFDIEACKSYVNSKTIYIPRPDMLFFLKSYVLGDLSYDRAKKYLFKRRMQLFVKYKKSEKCPQDGEFALNFYWIKRDMDHSFGIFNYKQHVKEMAELHAHKILK